MRKGVNVEAAGCHDTDAFPGISMSIGRSGRKEESATPSIQSDTSDKFKHHEGRGMATGKLERRQHRESD